MRTALGITLLSMTLAACQADTPEEEADACGAAEWMWLVGQPAEVIDTLTMQAPVRIIGPGDVVTTDFLPNRLNVSYSEEGVITDVRCG